MDINKEEFRAKVEKLKNIPTLPHLMMKFSKMAKDPHISMAAFGEEVSKDQVLTTKLLKLVNSAYYGFPGRISTVTQALVLLGLEALKGLIITSSVFDGLTPEAYPLWRHSLLVSLACRHIGNFISFPDIEEVAVAGLLHDIGKVIMIIEAAEDYRHVTNEAFEKEKVLWLMEDEMLGFNHTNIGGWVCKKWTLPEKLSIAIEFHHHPENVKEHHTRTYIVSAADSVVKGLGAAAEKGAILENIPDCVQDELKLTREHLEELAEKIEPEIESLQALSPGDLK